MATKKDMPPKVKQFLQNVGEKLSAKSASKKEAKLKRWATFSDKAKSNAIVGGTATVATVGAAFAPEIKTATKKGVKAVKKGVKKAKAFVDNTVKSMQSVGPKRNKDGVPMRKLK
jgi:hypothetical protein